MISGLDHIALAVPDLESARRDLEAVLGHAAIASPPGVPPTSRIQLGNVAMVLTSDPPDRHGSGAAAPPIGLAFATADIEATSRRLTRRALPVTRSEKTPTAAIALSATHFVPIELTAVHTPPPDPGHGPPRDIAGLDHVVIRTPDPERAVALYGGRLGLDLRLDRTNPAFASRMLFFVCGNLVVEITHNVKDGVGNGPDQIRGLAWRANDIEAAHRRMADAGVEVSELREGRRPATRVFTVRNRTCSIPTLIIGGEGLVRS